MKGILAPIFLIVGSIIGAGFASGRELSLFFAEFGYASLYFLPLVFILFYYLFKLFLNLGAHQKFDSVFDISKTTHTSKLFNVAIIVIFLIVSAAMFSGAVEVLSRNFIEIPVIFFYAFVFLIAFFVLKFGLNGLVKVNFIIIPLIVLLLVIYAFYSISMPITDLTFVPSNNKAYILPFSIVVYVFSNILLSYFILVKTGNNYNEKEVQKISFYSAVVICFVITICVLCLIKNGAVVMDASMPFVVLTLRMGEPFPIIFMLALFLGIITSLFSCLYTFSTAVKLKLKNKTALLSCCAVLFVSLLGFENIVNIFYPLIGLFGIAMVYRTYNTRRIFSMNLDKSKTDTQKLK